MTSYLSETLRLYHKSKESLRYAYVFEFDGVVYLDEGTVGNLGARQEFPTNQTAVVDQRIAELVSEGFAEAVDEDWVMMEISCPIKADFADDAERQILERLYEGLNTLLGLTGLGWADGTSHGSGMMDVGFYAIDHEIADETVRNDIDETVLGGLEISVLTE